MGHRGEFIALNTYTRTTIWPSNGTPRHSPQRNENLCSHKNLNVYGSFTHNSQKLEETITDT